MKYALLFSLLMYKIIIVGLLIENARLRKKLLAK